MEETKLFDTGNQLWITSTIYFTTWFTVSKRSKHRWHLLVTCVNASKRHADTMTQCFETYCHIFSFKSDKRYSFGFIYYNILSI